MKVLVTGASGFLGSHVVDACLAANHDVKVIVRPSSDLSYLNSLGNKIEILKGEFTDKQFLTQALEGVDGVVHSAARVSELGNREIFVEANVTITELLLDVSRQQGIKRFVFVSSPSVIAELKDHENIDESYPYPKNFLNYYCETKALAEQKVLSANSEGFTSCALRPRAVWGPRDTSGPFAKFLKKMMLEDLPNLSGGREVYTSICYVRNAADACVKALTSNKVGGKAYFITDREPVELWQMLERVATYFSIPKVKKSANLSVVRVAVNIVDLLWKIPYLRNNVTPPLTRYSLGLITHQATYSIERARKDLGYEAAISMDEALAEYKAWMEEVGGVKPYLNAVK